MSDTVITIAGKEYELVKRGRAQAEQAIKFSHWLTKYALPLFEQFVTPEGDAPDLDYVELFSLILDGLSVDALIDLFILLTGCNKKEADEHFEIGILFDAAGVVWDNQPGLRRVVQRFFSTQD